MTFPATSSRPYAAVPVVGISLLCKLFTGHGLPGDILAGGYL